MTNPISGVLQVMGEHDTGKTLFALSNGSQPERIAFIDDDVKGGNEVRQLNAQGREFGLYANLTKECKGMKDIALNEHCMKIIAALQPNAYDVLVWDTWTRFAATFHSIVTANPARYKDSYAPMGKIKSGEMYHVAWDLEAECINHILQVVPLVILVTHLKDDYMNGIKTGKQIPASTKAMERVCSMRVWLRHNPQSPEPIGLFLKRPNKLLLTENGLKPVNVLPRKMQPCTWDSIIAHWNNPVGSRVLLESEKPDEYELSILDGILTKDQKEMLKLAPAQERDDDYIMQPVPNGVPIGFKAALESGKSDEELKQMFSLNTLQLIKAKKG